MTRARRGPMRRFSLVISDVDGTLVTHDKRLTERTIAAVRRLHERGIGFSICSSRPPFGLRMMIEPLQLRLPFGGYNAGGIVEPDLTVVEQKLIPPDAAKEAVGAFQAQGVDCWVFTGNEWRIVNPDGAHVEHETHTIQTPPTVVPAFTDADFAAVGKIVGPSDDHAKVARLTELLQTALAGRANVARSQPYYCDVIPPGIDKGRLVELLGDRLARAARRDPGARRYGERPGDVRQGRVRRGDGECSRGGQAGRRRDDLVE